VTEQCSDRFARIFDSHCGGCRRQCICGRQHFDFSDNGWTWEDGELERLEAMAKKEPDIYIGHDGTIGTMEIDGVDIVYDCKCDNAAKYERFILAHAEQLAEYLRDLVRRDLEGAAEEKIKKVKA
jgi:hypothetical protein